MSRDEFIIFRTSTELKEAYKKYAEENGYRNESDLGREAIAEKISFEEEK